MARIWTQDAKYEAWLQVELAVCEVYGKRGLIPEDALGRIKGRARVQAARIDEIEATTRHDVIAFLTNLEEALGTDSRYVHMGLTSSDVVDTALGAPAPAGRRSPARGLERYRARAAGRWPSGIATPSAWGAPTASTRSPWSSASRPPSGTPRRAATWSASGGPARRCGWASCRARWGPSPTWTLTWRRRPAASSGSRPRRSRTRSSSATGTPSSRPPWRIVAASLEKVATEIRVAPAHRGPGSGGAVRGRAEGLERDAPQA